jgi:predicted DNA-binding transcriptional regulator YafY
MKNGKAKRGYALDVIKRLREMQDIIPLPPLKFSASEIVAKLEARGFVVTKRSVERDLVKLEAEGMGILYDGGHPRRWSYGRRVPARMYGIDLNTALTLKLAYEHVMQLVPASLLADLKTLVETAEKSLETTRDNNLSKWPQKIRVLSSAPVRMPPRVAPEVHFAVSEALLKNLQLRVRYKSLARGRVAEYVVSPLGMVLKGGLIYVVVWREDKDEPFTLRMNRISKADVENFDAKAPPNWSGLDSYIDAGSFLFPPSGKVEKDCLVILRFDSISAQNLKEIPLSADQTIKEEATRGLDGKPHCLVRARVTVSEEFVRWLLQYGDHVEVVKPESLRTRMRDAVASLYSRYKFS